MLYTFGKKMGPMANGALCLITPKHNGTFGTDHHYRRYASGYIGKKKEIRKHIFKHDCQAVLSEGYRG